MEFPTSKTLHRKEKNGVVTYTFPAFEAYPFVKHGFSTRLGGVSSGTFESMNLSYTRGDEAECVTQNFRLICDAMGMKAENVVVSSQKHHTTIRHVSAADRGKGIFFPRDYEDVDGLITDEPQVVLCTQYADCVPLLFLDPVKRVIAASHAGWRGTVSEIGAVTVEKMIKDYGCLAENILVGIAPSIGPCCFEVDAPVFDEFNKMSLFHDDCYTDDGNGKYHINLWKVNQKILESVGIKADNITVTDLCTRCNPDVFWSHRVLGDSRGSLAAFLSL